MADILSATLKQQLRLRSISDCLERGDQCVVGLNRLLDRILVRRRLTAPSPSGGLPVCTGPDLEKWKRSRDRNQISSASLSLWTKPDFRKEISKREDLDRKIKLIFCLSLSNPL
jgi:hypothetical protein